MQTLADGRKGSKPLLAAKKAAVKDGCGATGRRESGATAGGAGAEAWCLQQVPLPLVLWQAKCIARQHAEASCLVVGPPPQARLGPSTEKTSEMASRRARRRIRNRLDL